MTTVDRLLAALLILAAAGITVCTAALVTAVVGIARHSTATTIPHSYVILFWAINTALAIPSCWFLRHESALPRQNSIP